MHLRKRHFNLRLSPRKLVRAIRDWKCRNRPNWLSFSPMKKRAQWDSPTGEANYTSGCWTGATMRSVRGGGGECFQGCVRGGFVCACQVGQLGRMTPRISQQHICKRRCSLLLNLWVSDHLFVAEGLRRSWQFGCRMNAYSAILRFSRRYPLLISSFHNFSDKNTSQQFWSPLMQHMLAFLGIRPVSFAIEIRLVFKDQIASVIALHNRFIAGHPQLLWAKPPILAFFSCQTQ